MKPPKVIDNKRNGKVYDELTDNLCKGSKLSVISAYFTIYAFAELKREFSKIDGMRFIFTEPTFIKKDNELTREYYIEHQIEEKTQLYAAHQRINQNDSNKNTLEELIATEWFDDECPLFQELDIRQMRFTNYYTLYCDIVDAISIYNASSLIKAENQITGEQARELTEKVKQLEMQIAGLRAKLKNETQFNRQVEMN